MRDAIELGNPLLDEWWRIYGERRRDPFEEFGLEEGHRVLVERMRSREESRRRWAWGVPNEAVLDAIAEWGPVVEVGAGTGYWARLLSDRGVDVVACDVRPPPHPENGYHGDDAVPFFDVRAVGPEFAASHRDRTLLICWPPYDDPLAADAVEAHGGERLVYVGEGEGGCTADDRFFHVLDRDFRLVREMRVPRWDWVRDGAFFYCRVNPCGI